MGSYDSLGIKEYWLLEEWHVLPLLNLLTTQDCVSDSGWLAGRLQVSEEKVKKTIERLLTCGYLEKTVEGGWRRTSLKLRFPTIQSHKSVRDHHRAMIKKSLETLAQETSTEEFYQRLISGLSVAGDSRHIEEARLILEEALYKAAELLASGQPNEVFQMNVQFFKLSK